MRVKVLVEVQKRFRSMLWKEGRRPCGGLEERHALRNVFERNILGGTREADVF
jgi:hypothetical protein